MCTTNSSEEEAANASSSSFRQRTDMVNIGNIEKVSWVDRTKVMEGIVRAYDLHKAAETLDALLLEERILSCPILKLSFQANIDALRSEMKDILETPRNLFNGWENGLIDFVKYQIEHDEYDITKVPDKKLNGWLQRNRCRGSAYVDGNRHNLQGEALEKEEFQTKLLERLHVKWALFRHKSYDDVLSELREFKDKYGHLKVRRLQEDFPLLGERVAKLRGEYDRYQRGEKVFNLTEARVAELNAMGFIWRIRAARPRKGDPRFRLRRKSKDAEESSRGENIACDSKNGEEWSPGENDSSENGEETCHDENSSQGYSGV